MARHPVFACARSPLSGRGRPSRGSERMATRPPQPCPSGSAPADAARIEPLAGGVATDVWSVRVHGHLAVGRLGARGARDLAWETELLQHLGREGLTVTSLAQIALRESERPESR